MLILVKRTQTKIKNFTFKNKNSIFANSNF